MQNEPISPVVVICLVVLCVAATTLMLMIPAESLMVDLVYQAF